MENCETEDMADMYCIVVFYMMNVILTSYICLLSGRAKRCIIGGGPGKAGETKTGAGAQEEEEERVQNEAAG